MSIFRKGVSKVFSVIEEPLISERIVNESVLDESGNLINLVKVVKTDLSEINLPSKDEYDLEEQLKAGVSPQYINVHGVLQDENGSFDYVSAFNSLQNQIDSMNVSNVNENVESK